MLSPYRIPSNNDIKRRQKTSNTNTDYNSKGEHDLKWPQNALKRTT